jgi:hypothetical protein
MTDDIPNTINNSICVPDLLLGVFVIQIGSFSTVPLMAHQRPRFDLVQCVGQGLMSESKNINWVPMMSCVAGFPSEIVGFPPKSTKNLSVQRFLLV